MLRRTQIVVLAALLVFIAGADLALAKKPKRKQTPVPTGVWGGQHVRMEVTADGATVEFDCARGSLPRRLTTDANGHFEMSGAYAAENPGPTREDVAGDTNAVYRGTVKGDHMELTVSVNGVGAGEQAYRLTHGQEFRMTKCQ
jgi:hypothetical protein